MAKVVHGVMLVLAGISLFIVSIWLLVDTKHPKFRGLHVPVGHSPKIGVAASILLAISGILCCLVSKVNLRRSLILIMVLIVLGLTVACFGIAINDRLAMAEAEKQAAQITRKHSGSHGFGKSSGQIITDIEEFYSKFKTQLVVLAVIAGLDILVEIVSLITAWKWKEGYP